jgi:RNA-directed DNA polymerase
MVPVNRPNKDGKPSAEGEEGRPMIKEYAYQPHTTSTQSETRVSQGLEGVRKAAKENQGRRFTALLHHLTVDLLRESFFALKRKAAPGVDGVTWQDYEVGLEDRLIDLHGRVHRGAYRAQPSRRVYIPKSDGRQRPLGSRHWKTKSSNRPRSPSSTRFTKRTFSVSPMGFDRGAANMMRWMRWLSRFSGNR